MGICVLKLPLVWNNIHEHMQEMLAVKQASNERLDYS